MDRRRFTPSAEGLEGRALLSLFGGTSPATRNHVVSIEDLPETYQQRFNRIEHLPYYLRQAQPGRPLPIGTIQNLQADMKSVVGALHESSPEATTNFNLELRNLLPYKTLSPENAARLSATFGQVLSDAGATTQAVAKFQSDMNSLAQFDTLAPEPSILARQDYALVTQITMSVGRPDQTPTKPTLSVDSGVRTKDDAGGSTFDHSPTMVGTYEAGATRIGYVRMQIVDAAGTVLGTGVVDPSGRYSVQLNNLPTGKYELHSQPIDEIGNLSYPSPYGFILVVRDKPTPGHPSPHPTEPGNPIPISTVPLTSPIVTTIQISPQSSPIVTPITTPAGVSAIEITPVVTMTQSTPIVTPPQTIPIPNSVPSTPVVVNSSAASASTTTQSTNPAATAVVTTQPTPIATTSRSTIAVVDSLSQ